jgi:hypothetical protein
MKLVDAHTSYKENALSHRRFKHQEVLSLISKCGFEYETVGMSFEKRDIQKIKIGNGKRKILLWSQMHGDEATATMAIFDIINFFKSTDEAFKDLRQKILSELELHFVPMLNPDGAERFERRTAQGIDMNRDAVALQCPESKILKSLIEEIKPEFSFNLHDQAIYYAVGDSDVQTAVAFLATAYNKETEWNEVRTKAMQVICAMNQELQQIIPDRVGRFSDEFEPRAFGDNIQKWGSSLILIESGSYPEDTEKQYIRALNFHTILSGLYTIAAESYRNETLDAYESIPQNNRTFVDLKIVNLTVQGKFGDYSIDLGIIKEEKNNAEATDFEYSSVIEEMGDLSVFHGIKTLDAKGGRIRMLHEFPEMLEKYPDAPQVLVIGERATFIIDHNDTRTLILNGEIC